MASVDRRTFLKGIAAVSAATAGAVQARTDLGTSRSSLGAPAPAPPQWHKAPCHLCGAGCGLLVGIERGRAVAVKGDIAAGSSKGMACVKGYHAVQTMYGPDRITRALVRKDGTLVPVPLTEALDAVATALRETIARFGPASAGLYGSAQWSVTDAYVASKFFKGGIGSNSVETSARLHAAAVLTGAQTTFGRDGPIGTFEDVDHADVIVLWDTNLAESHPVLFSRILDRRRADPAVRIIDLTARTTRTSYASDRSLVHVPHSGLAIANAIAFEIIARKWADRAFINRHASFRRGRVDLGDGRTDSALLADPGADATWDEYVAFLAAYAPEMVAPRCGLSAAQLRWLASVYADRARRVVTVWDDGVHRSVRGAWLNNALYNIHLLLGKIATPGNSTLALTGQPNGGASVHDAGTFAHTLPAGTITNADDRERAARIWNVPAERLNAQPGRSALGMFRGLETGDIRFLWIQGTNPMLSLPNAARYRRAAARPDRFIVVSEAYPTQTTDVADVVLPAALWIERERIVINADRRVQHNNAVVAPPGDATSDAWLMIEVARRLGLGTLFPWTQQRLAEQSWEEHRRFHTERPTALPPYAELRARAGVCWPYVDGVEGVRRFSAAHDPAVESARGPVVFYGHADGRARIWLRPAAAPPELPDREFPFWLETGPVLEHWGGGTLTQRVPTLHRSVPHAYVEMHRDDASQLGVRHGDTARVRSRRGALELEVRIDYRAQPQRGLVFVPTFDEAHPVNHLTLDTQCPLSGQPGAGACAVRIERVTTRSLR